MRDSVAVMDLFAVAMGSAKLAMNVATYRFQRAGTALMASLRTNLETAEHTAQSAASIGTSQ